MFFSEYVLFCLQASLRKTNSLMSHAGISDCFAIVDVAAFAVYSRIVIVLSASKLAQNNYDTAVHGSFNAQNAPVEKNRGG